MNSNQAGTNDEAANVDDLTCQEFVALVTEYLEGTLDPHTRVRFENHLAECPDCPVYLRQIRELVGATGLLREEDLSPQSRNVLLGHFRSWKVGK